MCATVAYEKISKRGREIGSEKDNDILRKKTADTAAT